MKVILTKDVYKKGVAGEVVDVANGYARNYLIPQGMAVNVTAGALKQMGKLRQQAAARRQMRDDELAALAEKVEALTLTFPVKAGEMGKLYGSVTTANIGDALEAEIGAGIDRRRIGDQPLRQLGEHKVAVRLSSLLTPQISVLVHREGELPESVLGIEPDVSELEEEVGEILSEGEMEGEIDTEASYDIEAEDGVESEAGDEAEDSEASLDIEAELESEAKDGVEPEEGDEAGDSDDSEVE